MSSKDINLSEVGAYGIPEGKECKIGIAVSDWNNEITDKLLEACLKTLKDNGVQEAHITTVRTPGAFELPFAARTLIKHAQPEAVICLGCVIKGETRHDEYINRAVASGITQLGLATDIPVIFGVLTVENKAQAEDRAGGKHGNKGDESAHTALKMIALKKQFTGSSKKIGY